MRVNQVVQELKAGSVLSMQNAAALLYNNCRSSGKIAPGYSQSLHLIMNLDSKYSKVQVYNRREAQSDIETDDNDLADFLSDLPEERVNLLTASPGI